jgi:predicted dienelactone hydrolase
VRRLATTDEYYGADALDATERALRRQPVDRALRPNEQWRLKLSRVHFEIMIMRGSMRSVWVASAFLGLLVSTVAANAAGIQALTIPPDSGASPALAGAVWYPCAMKPVVNPTAMKLGGLVVSAVKDCPITGDKLPLVVISHGRTGSYLGHHDTAQALADAGFVVAAVSHPGDNAQDGSRSNELSAFVDRPADIKRLVDYMLGSWSNAAVIDADRIGLFGFSRGGYTGLVVLGAKPSFSPRIGMCAGKTNALCEQVREGRLEPLAHDGRIKAAVIADPLSIFFTKTSFDDVRAPIQLWRSERGGGGVTPESVAAVAEALPVKTAVRTVPNAQHFSFLPPCPDELARSAHELCTDPPGFDREAFHTEFNAQVLDFFRHALR